MTSQKSSHPGRFVLIFLFVAVATCGGIFLYCNLAPDYPSGQILDSSSNSTLGQSQSSSANQTSGQASSLPSSSSDARPSDSFSDQSSSSSGESIPSADLETFPLAIASSVRFSSVPLGNCSAKYGN